MTKIYEFDPEFFYLVREFDAEIDPRTKEPLVPGYGHSSRTIVKPPAVERGFIPVFDPTTETWAAVENHHGRLVFDKVTRDMSKLTLANVGPYTKLGPIPDKFTTLQPPSKFHVWDESLGQWVEDAPAKEADDKAGARRSAIEVDAQAIDVLDKLRNATPAQIDAFVANATIARLREIIAGMLKVLALRI